MRLKTHGSHAILPQVLRQTVSAAAGHGKWLRRYSSNEAPKDIGIFGGGITGLAAAFSILDMHSTNSPNAPPPNITIYESGPRLGGWIRSLSLKTPGGDEVVFEQGPRTLRTGSAGSLFALDMISKLGLSPAFIGIGKTSPMLRRRYVYYRNSLQEVPPSIPQFAEDIFSNDSLFNSLVPGLIGEVMSGKRRPVEIEDESVGDFITRRFNRDIAEKFASAMMHGIYAGDVWQLSAATILPRLWAIDGESDSLTLELLLKDYKVTVAEAHYLNNAWNSMDLSGNEGMILREMWLQSGVFTLQGGLEQLTKALEVALRLTGSVKFSMERAVEAIEFCAQAKQVEVHINGEAPQSHDRVISTISAPALSKIANLPTLSDIPSVTVGLVNLFYSDNQLQNRQGFGYLIPNCPSVPNPTSALGVIFDSCVVPDAASGTKLTVMLGGHLWDSQYPEGADLSREALFDLAKRTVATQLGITATPTLWDATLQKNCIPQYTVGFNQRMAQAHEELKSKYCGLLSVAGSSFNGVGVNDCIYAARIAAALLLSNKHFTGLEKYTYEDEWVPRPKLEF